MRFSEVVFGVTKTKSELRDPWMESTMELHIYAGTSETPPQVLHLSTVHSC